MSSLLLLLLPLTPRLLVFVVVVVVDFFLFDDDDDADRLIADPLGKEMVVAAAGNRRGRLALLSAYEG